MGKKKRKKAKLEQERIEKERIGQIWEEYKSSVNETKNKSQDDFEKYINLIASGALALTITFIDKIVPISNAIYIWIIATGWGLLALTLLLNLYSHHKSVRFAEQTISDIDKGDYDDVTCKTKKNNFSINLLNEISLYSLFLGVISIVIFVTLNIYNMSDKSTSRDQEKPAVRIDEGRTVSTPPSEKPKPEPKK